MSRNNHFAKDTYFLEFGLGQVNVDKLFQIDDIYNKRGRWWI